LYDTGVPKPIRIVALLGFKLLMAMNRQTNKLINKSIGAVQ